MFINETDNETDFCESYKSQILNEHTQNTESSLGIIFKILTILLLVAVIVAVSLYGYNYFMNSKKDMDSPLTPVSMQISEKELKVTSIDEKIIVKEEKVLKSEIESIPKIEELDIEQIANNVKIAISDSENAEKIEEQKNEMIKVVEEKLEIPLSPSEAKYLEELADLSREIDKERK